MTIMMDVSTDNRTNILQSKMEDINKNILNSLSEENAALQKEQNELHVLNNEVSSSTEQQEVDATDAINHIQQQNDTSDKYRRQISDCTVHISNIAATTAASATSSNDQQDSSLALTGLTSTNTRGRLNSLDLESSDAATTTSSDADISLNPEVSSHMSTLTPASPLTISASTFNDSAISNISIDKNDGVVSYDKEWFEMDRLDNDKNKKMTRKEEPVEVKEGEVEQKRVVTVTSKQSEEKRRLPARRLPRNNSAKGGSFRGSLKNVLENAPLDEDDDDNDSPPNLTKTHEKLVDNMDSFPKRGITRSNSGRGGSFRFRKGDNKLPMRYIPRSSSAKGASSFRHGIPETRPDDNLDSSTSLTSQELVQTLQSQEDMLQARINEMENLILSGGVDDSVSSSRSHPPTGSILQSIAASSSYDTSFRSNLLESIHLYNSTSSLSSASTMHTSGIDSSINIMDFGVSHSRLSVDSSETTTSTSDNNDDGTITSTPSQISIVSTLSGNRTNSSRSLLSSNKTNSARSLLSDSDGFIGWGQSRDSKKVTPTRGRKTLSKKSKGPTLFREESNLSNLSDLVDSEGFLKWDSKRDLGSFDTSSPSMTKEEREEETADVVSEDLKQAGNLVKQFKRLSSNLTASIKRSSWEINNDNSRPFRNSTGTIPRRSSDIPDMTIRRSTGNNDRPNRRSSLFNSVFSRRKSNAGDDNSSEDDEYYTQNIRPRVKREDSEACIDIGELRRELCEAAEEGTDKNKGNNLNRKLKNVIF